MPRRAKPGTKAALRRLESALCTLADYEDVIKDRLIERHHRESAHGDVCDALRLIVDGPDKS